MKRFKLTHKLFFFSIFALSLCLTSLFLGFWQLERLEQKQALLTSIFKATHETTSPLDAIVDTDLTDPSKLAYKPVSLEGKFDLTKKVFIAPKVLEGRIGGHVVVPLVLKTGTTVFVNLGWSPKDMTPSLPEGVVKFTGVLRFGNDTQNFFVPENNPQKNQWVTLDVRDLSQHFGLGMSLPFYVQLNPQDELIKHNSLKTASGSEAKATETATESGPSISPLPIIPNIPNNHLIYALTWFCLAIALGIGYIVYIRREGVRFRSLV